jgi:hypothetical protein
MGQGLREVEKNWLFAKHNDYDIILWNSKRALLVHFYS